MDMAKKRGKIMSIICEKNIEIESISERRRMQYYGGEIWIKNTFMREYDN
jgi:hypothetical protein